MAVAMNKYGMGRVLLQQALYPIPFLRKSRRSIETNAYKFSKLNALYFQALYHGGVDGLSISFFQGYYVDEVLYRYAILNPVTENG